MRLTEVIPCLKKEKKNRQQKQQLQNKDTAPLLMIQLLQCDMIYIRKCLASNRQKEAEQMHLQCVCGIAHKRPGHETSSIIGQRSAYTSHQISCVLCIVNQYGFEVNQGAYFTRTRRRIQAFKSFKLKRKFLEINWLAERWKC